MITQQAMPGARGVGGGGGGGVAGGGADDGLRPAPVGLGDRRTVMPRSLKEPVGLSALELEAHFGADELREDGGAQQRRGALLEGDERITGREWKPLAVALDEGYVALGGVTGTPLLSP